MQTTNELIQSLVPIIDKNPQDISLRLHLADLFLQNDDANAALSHYVQVLGCEPTNSQALKGAALAAQKSGDTQKHNAYKQVLDALGDASADIPIDVETHDDGAVVGLAKATDAEQQNNDTVTKKEASDVARNRPKLRVVEGNAENCVPLFDADHARVTLADVGGMTAVKKRLNLAFLGPLKNPEIRKMYKKKLKGGLLLYGPPGCGKTYIAQALAGELRARFMSVGLAEVVDMWFGESEQNLHKLFETARNNRPTVLFFDELDALGRKRSQLTSSGGRNIVNQMLIEMDGVDNNNDGLFILGATNQLWDIDVALRRPGRFDRVVFVPPPDFEARQAILQLHEKERPTEKIDYRWIAQKTDHFSGADLVHLWDTATEFAMEESIESGNVRRIGKNDFKRALTEVRPSIVPWIETAKNYAKYANENEQYNDLIDYLKASNL